jgi:hypothetical protein
MSCAICLDDDSQKDFYVTTCNHTFHNECLLKTKLLNSESAMYKSEFTVINCPLCRNKLSIYNINYKIFYSGLLEKDLYKQLVAIYHKIKGLHLNKEYTFIAGGFAAALYSKLTNKNTLYEFSDIDIYYIDYHNLYESNILKLYGGETNNCNFKSSCVKSMQKHQIMLNPYKIVDADVILLNKGNNSSTSTIEDTILTVFDNTDLSCCKIAFTLKDDLIKFYIHSDYYKKTAHICHHSIKKTKKRIAKYKHRGYSFEYYSYCCGVSPPRDDN